ncbi:MAG TPA: type II toxin-antitoxin system HicA family toxin [Verrucomicrobia bacterium]|nr:type II toxin-antitoxin system HicA family toxin [Verrucomicrobiota bacterium]
MPKRKRLSGEKACHILKSAGFICVRQRGCHMVMQMRTGDSTVTVPVPMHRELKPGTLASIIRQSRLSKDQFE